MNSPIDFEKQPWLKRSAQQEITGALLESHLCETIEVKGYLAAAKILNDLGFLFEDAHALLLKCEPRRI